MEYNGYYYYESFNSWKGLDYFFCSNRGKAKRKCPGYGVYDPESKVLAVRTPHSKNCQMDRTKRMKTQISNLEPYDTDKDQGKQIILEQRIICKQEKKVLSPRKGEFKIYSKIKVIGGKKIAATKPTRRPLPGVPVRTPTKRFAKDKTPSERSESESEEIVERIRPKKVEKTQAELREVARNMALRIEEDARRKERENSLYQAYCERQKEEQEKQAEEEALQKSLDKAKKEEENEKMKIEIAKMLEKAIKGRKIYNEKIKRNYSGKEYEYKI